MAAIIPESATLGKSMQLLKCQPILNHPRLKMPKTKQQQTEQTYRGYTIIYRPWLKHRPYRCQVPNTDRWADWATLDKCKHLIDQGIAWMEQKKNG